MRIWIKDPLAILAPGAERGVVVEGDEIVELVAARRAPAAPVDATFDASRHVVLPGPRQYPSSFLSDADPRPSRRDQQGAVPLAGRALSDLGAAEARRSCASRCGWR